MLRPDLRTQQGKRGTEDDQQGERLTLEKFSDHPELEGERQMMDVFEPDLEMYYRLP